MANFTKQAIETAFLQLLNEKPLNKISVRDIVEKCGINRNSFYYHFQDIPSLIAEIITACTDRLIEEYPTISTLDECCEMAVRYALRNRSAVMHIYHSVNRDLFEKSTMRLCEYAVTTYIDTAFPQHQLPEADRKAVIRFIKCQIFGMCIDWISDGMQDEALEELRPDIEDMFECLKDAGFGHGISAPQIGIKKRLICLDLDGVRRVIVNPTLELVGSEMMELMDDCLCFPGLLVKVRRNRRCIVRYRDENWQVQELACEGYLSELIQHEYDHLNGILATMRAVDGKAFVMKA